MGFLSGLFGSNDSNPPAASKEQKGELRQQAAVALWASIVASGAQLIRHVHTELNGGGRAEDEATAEAIVAGTVESAFLATHTALIVVYSRLGDTATPIMRHLILSGVFPQLGKILSCGEDGAKARILADAAKDEFARKEEKYLRWQVPRERMGDAFGTAVRGTASQLAALFHVPDSPEFTQIVATGYSSVLDRTRVADRANELVDLV